MGKVFVKVTGDNLYLQDFRIPGKDQRAGKVPAFDSDGNLETSIDSENLIDIDASVKTAVQSAADAAADAAHADDVAAGIDAVSPSFKHRMTGVRLDAIGSSEITLGEDGLLHIPELKLLFNKTVYYGDSVGDFELVDIPAQSFACQALPGAASRVFFLVANIDGAISMQADPVTAAMGASKCLLGSGFALYDADGSSWSFQAGSWKYMPWLVITGADARMSGAVTLSHALVVPKADTSVKLTEFKAMAEGINAAVPSYPSVMEFGASDPWLFKYLYPGYDAGQPMRSALDGRALYDLDSGTLQESDAEGKYAVYVPFVTPTGQGIIIVPQGHYDAEAGWDCNYNSIEEVVLAIPGMSYDLTGLSTRLIPLGISFVVRVGNIGPNTSAGNFTLAAAIPNQFASQSASQLGISSQARALAPIPQFGMFAYDGTLSDMGVRGTGVYPAAAQISKSMFGAYADNPIDILEAQYQGGTPGTISLGGLQYDCVWSGASAGTGRCFVSMSDYNSIGRTPELIWGRQDGETYYTPNYFDFGELVEEKTGITGEGFTNGWYRKYKSGWVEQGGFVGSGTGFTTVVLPVPMANADYNIQRDWNGGKSAAFAAADWATANKTATTFIMNAAQSSNVKGGDWLVNGMAAASPAVTRRPYFQIASGGVDNAAEVAAAAVVADVAALKDASNLTDAGKAAVCGLLVPDYSRMEARTKGITYTAPAPGWMLFCDNIATGTGNAQITINGTQLFGTNTGAAPGYPLFVPLLLKAGDTYNVTGGSGAIGFYNWVPCSGV
ncbi:MAG: hypothetical protein LBO78_01970 [Rickettsiales bacterium]|jgi:hypothetical protein|nr:hypothetical protein [Rickettsiales bacterium]